MKNSVKFNKKRLVDYIWNNLNGSNNESLTVWTSPNSEFVHTRNSDYRDDEHEIIVHFRTGDDSPKSKAEVKRMVDYYLANDNED